MSRSIPNSFWIILTAGLVCLTGLGATHLWDDDETLYSSCAREMLARGDWVTPTFNGNLFADKPPLVYWMMIGSFKLWGVNEFAARFPSALCALLTAWVTYQLGRILFCERAGFWAGLITTTTIAFAVSARAATLDSALTLLTTLAFLVFARARIGPQDPETLAAHGWKAWGHWVLLYGLLGLAILTKGPVGAVLPLGAMGLFLLISHVDVSGEKGTASFRSRWLRGLAACFSVRNVFWAIGKLRPLTAIVVVGVVVLPWYLLVNARTDGVFLQRFLGEQNFLRALRPMDGHSGPIFYYLIAILVGFFPWSVFLLSAWAQLGRRLNGHPWQQSYRLLLCWMSLFVVFWSLVSTKLPHYVLPAYPALALAVGGFLDAWLASPAGSPRRWGRNAAITLIVVGIALMVALPVVASYVLPGEGMLGLIGVIFVVGGGVLWWEFDHARLGRALGLFTILSVVFLVVTLALAAQCVDRHQAAPRLLAAIRESAGEQPPLCTYRFQRPSLVFYAGQRVPHCSNDQALADLYAANRPPWIITGGEFEKELERLFPNRLMVAARCPKFAKRGEIVVLAPRPIGTPPTTAQRGADSPR